MQTFNAYLEAMMTAAALAQRIDEAEYLIYFGYEASPAVCGPDDWIKSYTIDGHSLELVKPRQPKLPPLKQSRFGHMPLLPSRFPPIDLKHDAYLANEAAWRRKREFGWPTIKQKE